MEPTTVVRALVDAEIGVPAVVKQLKSQGKFGYVLEVDTDCKPTEPSMEFFLDGVASSQRADQTQKYSKLVEKRLQD